MFQKMEELDKKGAEINRGRGCNPHGNYELP